MSSRFDDEATEDDDGTGVDWAIADSLPPNGIVGAFGRLFRHASC
jgi:hypothetical protein